MNISVVKWATRIVTLSLVAIAVPVGATLPTPTNLVTSPVSGTKYQVSWTPAVGSTSSELTFTNGSAVYRLRTTGSSIAPNFPLSGSWTVGIKGRTSTEVGPAASTTFTVNFAAPSATPSGVSTTGSDQRVDLRWTAGSYTDSLLITWLDPLTNLTQQLVTKGTFASIRGLQNNINYVFTLTWSNSVGSGPSMTITGMPTSARPSTPITPDTTAVSPNSSALTWPPVPGATYYITYYGGSTNFTTLKNTGSKKITTTPYTTLTGVQSNWYTYIVAGNASGTGPVNPTATPLPIVTAPQVAPTFTLNAGLQSATASWTIVPGATSYTLAYMPSPFTLGAATQIQNATNPTVLGSLTEWVEIGAGALGTNLAGDGPLSTVEVATPFAPPTEQPSVLLAAGQTSIDVSWNAIPHADSYTLLYMAGSTLNPQTAFSIPVSGTAYPLSGLTSGTTYVVAVQAHTIGGSGPLSESVTATPLAPPASAPTVSLTAEQTTLTVTWSTVTDAASYQVYWQIGANVNEVTATSVSVSGLTTSLTGLTASTQYAVKVRAINMSGNGPFSTIQTITTTAPPYNFSGSGSTIAGLPLSLYCYDAYPLSDGRAYLFDTCNIGLQNYFLNPTTGVLSNAPNPNAVNPTVTSLGLDTLPDGRFLMLKKAVFTPSTNTWASVSTVNDGAVDNPDMRAILLNGQVFMQYLVSRGHKNQAIIRHATTGALVGIYNLLGETERNYPSFTRLQDGQILIAGGHQNTQSPTSCTAGGCAMNTVSAQRFNPSTNTPIATGAMLTPRADHQSTLLNDGRVLIFGGQSAIASGDFFTATNRLTNAEVFNPTTGTWASAGSLPSGYIWTTNNYLNLRENHPIPNPDGTITTIVYKEINSYWGFATWSPTTNTWSVIDMTAYGENNGLVPRYLGNGKIFIGNIYNTPPTIFQ